MCLGQTACKLMINLANDDFVKNHALCTLNTGHPHWNSLQTCPSLWKDRQSEAQERH